MNNGDKPFIPIVGADGEPAYEGTVKNPQRLSGLTKREYIATMAMQGLLSHNYPHGRLNNIELPDIRDIVTQSISYTDELLKQLEEK